MKSQFDVFPKKLTLFGILILTSAYVLLMVRISQSRTFVSDFYKKDAPGLQLYCGASRLVSLNQMLEEVNAKDPMTMKLNQQGIRYSLDELTRLGLGLPKDPVKFGDQPGIKSFLSTTSEDQLLSTAELETVKTEMADFIESYLFQKNLLIEKEDQITKLVALLGIIGIVLFLGIFFYVYRLYLRNIQELTILTQNLEKQRATSMQSAKLASLGEMAGGIAHEINNPLAIISFSTKVLRKKMDKGELDEETVKKSLDQVDETVSRISKIIKGLRNVSRDSDREPPQLVVIQEIIDDVLAVCSERLKNNLVHFEVEDPGEVRSKSVLCNRIQIAQVLVNLIGNAFDAILGDEGEKWIRLKLSLNPETLTFAISDSGKPIPPEVREKLFQPFFTTKDIGKGTGLGLSISKSIIESHKGRLFLSEKTGINEFIIELPAQTT